MVNSIQFFASLMVNIQSMSILNNTSIQFLKFFSLLTMSDKTGISSYSLCQTEDFTNLNIEDTKMHQTEILEAIT